MIENPVFKNDWQNRTVELRVRKMVPDHRAADPKVSTIGRQRQRKNQKEVGLKTDTDHVCNVNVNLTFI